MDFIEKINMGYRLETQKVTYHPYIAKGYNFV
jgi:hypothetical protein